MSRSNPPPTNQEPTEDVETLTPDTESNVYTVRYNQQTFVLHEQATQTTIYRRTSTASGLTNRRLLELVQAKEVHAPWASEKDMLCNHPPCTKLHSFQEFCESELESHFRSDTVVRVDVQHDHYGTSIDASSNPLGDAEQITQRLMEQTDTATPLVMETYNSDGQRFLEVSAPRQLLSALLSARRQRRRGPGSGRTSR